MQLRRLTPLALALPCLLAAPVALADEAADMLKKIDAQMTESKDQVSTLKMILEDADGKTKERTIAIKQKGNTLRMIKFISPADVKGVGFLVKSDEEMYLYMPEFGKVRRIASHVQGDDFMGTDFSYNDIGSTDYADGYDARLLSKDAKQAQLELKPKKGKDSAYAKLVLTVDLEHWQATIVKYFDKKGGLWKEMTSSDYKDVSGHWVPQRIRMQDHKKKHATIMEMSDIEFDTGLKDSDFSKRKLKRSR